MNAPFAISATTPSTASVMPYLRDFTLENTEQLEWLLAASGAHEQLAALRHLIEDFYEDSADPGHAVAILNDIRHHLRDLPVYNPFAYLRARPDLDACIRWLGAQLDGILDDIDQG
ncbi:hypothetical protein [Salipiger sp.]|uniref:hypothetical protein n=1 Tax=Salipiger sp. TaxID=2078585 RepID=UPI003A96E262